MRDLKSGIKNREESKKDTSYILRKFDQALQAELKEYLRLRAALKAVGLFERHENKRRDVRSLAIGRDDNQNGGLMADKLFKYPETRLNKINLMNDRFCHYVMTNIDHHICKGR